MRIKRYYEWVIEQLNSDGDIEDTCAYAESELWEALTQLPDCKYSICLTVNEGNDEEGVVFREWAYVENGQLPNHFGNMPNYKVPQRFQKQFDREIKKSPKTVLT